MITTVTLNPSLDLGLEVPSLREGKVNRAISVRKAVGGKGINMSHVLKELGESTTALTIIGSDTITQFQRLARSAGFPIIYISIPGEVRTNIHLFDPESSAMLKVNQSGDPLNDANFQHFKLLFRKQLQTTRLVAMGGSLPPARGDDSYAELIRLAHDLDRPVLLDTEGAPLLEALKEKPMLVKPNRVELEATLETTFATTRELIEGAREVQNRGARGVVVSDGDRGVIGLWDKEVWMATPPKVEVKGATGAGDAVAAGLLSGINRRRPFSESLRLGVAAGTATCLRPEGQLADADDIRRILPRVRVRKVSRSGPINDD